MARLTRDQILGATALREQVVPVPEWGGEVCVRELDGVRRDAFQASLIGEDGKPDTTGYAAKLVAFSLVGDDGQPMFSLADVGQLRALSSAAMQRVFEVADRLSAPSAQAVDAAEKNSAAGQTGASS